MKKTVIALSAFTVILFYATIFGVNQAMSESADVFIGEGECRFLDGNGELFTTNNIVVVITNNNNNSVNFTCKASGVPNDTGKTVRYSGPEDGSCRISGFGLEEPQTSFNWKQTVSPSGKAIAHCHLKAD